MVDLMTCIPIFATYQQTCPSFEEAKGIQIVYYILCAMNTTRILRALRFRREFDLIEDAIERFLANMCLYIVVMILFSKSISFYFFI